MNWFDYLNYFMFGLFAICTLYPFIYVLAGSFNNGADYSAGGVWFYPRVLSFANYEVVFRDVAFWKAFGITFSVTIIGTFFALLFTSIVAYAMSRNRLKFRKFFWVVNLMCMFFSGGLIPYFMVINLLGLYDNYLVYIVPSLYSVYNMIILQNFFKTVPEEIHDAALIDGAGELRICFQIYIPLSKPALATVGLWLATGFWNSYFSSMVYTRGGDLSTLQYYLMKLIKQAASNTAGMDPSLVSQTTSATISFAAIVISMVPILCVYPLIQKNFAKGVLIGSLKE